MAIAESLTPDLTSGEPDPETFLRKLSLELARCDVRLPSFPDISVRVQQILEDPRATRSQVAHVIAADAALAARILRLANSAFLNPSAIQITDLKQALTRLGHQLVRCTAVSFALQQINLGSGQAELRLKLKQLWREGTLVASIAFVLARETRAAKPDEALVTGLMHNIGRLYITVSTPNRTTDGGESEAWVRMVRDWHPRIARSILKNWKFPAAVIAAVADQNAWDRETRGDERLTDLLIAALALASCVFHRELLDDAVTAIPPFQRLGLGAADARRLLAATGEQIKALRAALTG
jgi:HD-like signal output (HDOD) protein